MSATGQLAYPEAALRAGNDEMLLSQTGQRLADDGLADTKPVGKVDQPQLLPWREHAVEQVTPNVVVDLFGSRHS